MNDTAFNSTEHMAAIITALENYAADLAYWIGTAENSEQGVNCHTCGTPYFETIGQAEQYAADLGQLITASKGGLSNAE